jgi:hypothetical protein
LVGLDLILAIGFLGYPKDEAKGEERREKAFIVHLRELSEGKEERTRFWERWAHFLRRGA